MKASSQTPLLRVDRLTLGCASLVGLVLLYVSLARYNAYRVWMQDIGNMAQAIWSVTQGRPLEFTYIADNISRLALHAELIYVAIAPLYALFPDPRTLLVLQSALFALGVIPAYRLGLRATSKLWMARGLAAMYLFYPVAQSAVLFDFHGDTLALPLVLFALDALDARQWRRYCLFSALALLCKVYVAVPLVVLGLVLWCERSTRRIGTLTALTAASYFCLIFFVVRPLFQPSDTRGGMGSPLAYLRFYFDIDNLNTDALVARSLRAIIVFAPIVPLLPGNLVRLLPGLVVAAAALLSTRPDSGSIRSAHYGLVVPFLIWAAAGTLAGSAQATTSRRAIRILLSLVLSISLSVYLLVTLIHFELGTLASPPRDALLRSERDKLRDRWLAEVPPEAPLAASLFLTPRLLERETLFVARFPGYMDIPDGQEERNLARTHYIVSDALFDYRVDQWNFELPVIERALRHPDFSLIEQRDGLLLFAREAAAGDVLQQEARLVATSDGAVQAHFGGTIVLRNSSVEHIADRRYRARFVWNAGQDLTDQPRLMAVSRLDGVALSRIVHLPTLGLLPTPTWTAGTTIEEVFEFEVARELPPGSYPLLIGWYDTTVAGMALGDGTGRIGDEVMVAILEVK
jgi:uncharacterized membrane protein